MDANSAEIIAWTRIQNRLKNFVLRYTKDKALAEDIVHDVFLKVHDRLPQLRESDKITGWIFRMAKNTITDYFRKKARHLRVVDLDWDSDGVTLNDCVSYCLYEMLHTLPAKYREALEGAEVSGMSQTELARREGISYSAMKSRVQRARQMLRDKMENAYRIQFDHYGNAILCERQLPCGCS